MISRVDFFLVAIELESTDHLAFGSFLVPVVNSIMSEANILFVIVPVVCGCQKLAIDIFSLPY